jgi:hypothetical protein
MTGTKEPALVPFPLHNASEMGAYRGKGNQTMFSGIYHYGRLAIEFEKFRFSFRQVLLPDFHFPCGFSCLKRRKVFEYRVDGGSHYRYGNSAKT